MRILLLLGSILVPLLLSSIYFQLRAYYNFSHVHAFFRAESNDFEPVDWQNYLDSNTMDYFKTLPLPTFIPSPPTPTFLSRIADELSFYYGTQWNYINADDYRNLFQMTGSRNESALRALQVLEHLLSFNATWSTVSLQIEQARPLYTLLRLLSVDDSKIQTLAARVILLIAHHQLDFTAFNYDISPESEELSLQQNYYVDPEMRPANSGIENLIHCVQSENEFAAKYCAQTIQILAKHPKEVSLFLYGALFRIPICVELKQHPDPVQYLNRWVGVMRSIFSEELYAYEFKKNDCYIKSLLIAIHTNHRLAVSEKLTESISALHELVKTDKIDVFYSATKIIIEWSDIQVFFNILANETSTDYAKFCALEIIFAMMSYDGPVVPDRSHDNIHHHHHHHHSEEQGLASTLTELTTPSPDFHVRLFSSLEKRRIVTHDMNEMQVQFYPRSLLGNETIFTVRQIKQLITLVAKLSGLDESDLEAQKHALKLIISPAHLTSCSTRDEFGKRMISELQDLEDVELAELLMRRWSEFCANGEKLGQADI